MVGERSRHGLGCALDEMAGASGNTPSPTGRGAGCKRDGPPRAELQPADGRRLRVRGFARVDWRAVGAVSGPLVSGPLVFGPLVLGLGQSASDELVKHGYGECDVPVARSVAKASLDEAVSGWSCLRGFLP